MKVNIHCDGAIEPVNPGGWGAFGYIISFPDNPEKKPIRGYGSLGKFPWMTNNIAEWEGLLNALIGLRETDIVPSHICIFSDSQLIINQVSLKWRCRGERNVALRDECRKILYNFACTWEANWIPREENYQADALSRQVYETIPEFNKPIDKLNPLHKDLSPIETIRRMIGASSIKNKRKIFELIDQIEIQIKG